MIIETKVCSKCGKEKGLGEFYSDKRARDGKMSTCKVCHREGSRKWKADNPGRVRENDRVWCMNNPEKIWTRATLSKHRKRKFEIKISRSELEQIAKATRRCPYCTRILSWGGIFKKGRPQSNSPTLDRIHNGKIIDKDTIQILCFDCNTLKGNRSESEVRDHALKLASNISDLLLQREGPHDLGPRDTG